MDLAIPISNAYGLLLLTVLMSYGLVEIPKGLWYNSNVAWKLRKLEIEIPHLRETCIDAEAELYEAVGVN